MKKVIKKYASKTVIVCVISFMFVATFSFVSAKSDTAGVNYYIGYKGDPVDRNYGGGTVGVNHVVQPIEGNISTICANKTINFVYNPELTFNHSGGLWDTPYGAWCNNLNQICGV